MFLAEMLTYRNRLLMGKRRRGMVLGSIGLGTVAESGRVRGDNIRDWRDSSVGLWLYPELKFFELASTSGKLMPSSGTNVLASLESSLEQFFPNSSSNALKIKCYLESVLTIEEER
ncbi:hypothetical protein NA56DRAFT_712455 [Hyaloscypha hepaticicola]|uniref:Uncharacterized protein n=1 Tax=Hyaloscypha hepaticicola TaxID=2082293 RepID=A0A2J6PG17_9HELO|nr:hypothetical protein NA56DRAFT_712455 [Hyaloscypha hepaticicola]